MWRRLHFRHAVVPALSRARHTPVHAAQRQADQGIGHVLNINQIKLNMYCLTQLCTVGSRFTTGLRSRIFGRKSNRLKTSTI